MNTLSIKESVAFGWETFKKQPWMFVAATVVFVIVSMLLARLTDEKSGLGLIMAIAGIAGNVLLEMGTVSFAIKAHDDADSTTVMDLWHPQPFWKYLGAKVLQSIFVILPTAPFAIAAFFFGIGAIGLSPAAQQPLTATFAVLMFVATVIGLIFYSFVIFTSYLVIDKGMGPVQAVKESIRVTKGNRLSIFLLLITIGLLNIAGALALFVGLLISIPVSMLALVHAYRKLEHAAGEVVPAV